MNTANASIMFKWRKIHFNLKFRANSPICNSFPVEHNGLRPQQAASGVVQTPGPTSQSSGCLLAPLEPGTCTFNELPHDSDAERLPPSLTQ